jgi:hypothetical protein
MPLLLAVLVQFTLTVLGLLQCSSSEVDEVIEVMPGADVCNSLLQRTRVRSTYIKVTNVIAMKARLN